jgi:hypothetical protein
MAATVDQLVAAAGNGNVAVVHEVDGLSGKENRGTRNMWCTVFKNTATERKYKSGRK